MCRRIRSIRSICPPVGTQWGCTDAGCLARACARVISGNKMHPPPEGVPFSGEFDREPSRLIFPSWEGISGRFPETGSLVTASSRRESAANLNRRLQRRPRAMPLGNGALGGILLICRLTHISERYRPEEILTEAARYFANVRVVGDFDRISFRRLI